MIIDKNFKMRVEDINEIFTMLSFVLKLCYKIKLIYPLSKPPKVLFEHRLTLFRRETPTECKVTKKFGNQMYLTTLIKLLYVDLDIF